MPLGQNLGVGEGKEQHTAAMLLQTQSVHVIVIPDKKFVLSFPVMSEPPLTILVIDDEVNHADVIAVSLEKIGAVCQVVHSQKDAVKKIEGQYFDVIITDLMLEKPDGGIEILKTVKKISAETEVIVITANNSIEIAVEAMQLGAFNYLQKPLDLKQLRTIAERAGESAKLRRINRDLEHRLDEKFGFSGVLGNSPQMLAVVERLRRIAPTDATVLIQGETGTGKELFAQSLHQNSLRKAKPFVALNCGALSENILESELFGHVKGAFTDASSDRLGKFEYANGGTMFLDEVGDMPMPTQIKLLRVLENGEVTRVGSNNTIKVNVRLLSATNRNLEEAVSAGTFRQDLYHRLKVVTIRIPPLRERTEDIPVLLDHFVRQFAKKYGKTIKGIAPAARKALFGFAWLGNVRQLRNVAESMVVVDYDEILDADDLPEELGGGQFADSRLRLTADRRPLTADLQDLIGRPMAEIERLFITETLKFAEGNRKEAAKILDIGERTLYRKIEEYGLE
ncbi:MAG: sigma-54 dependent transcriptional regulator [Planctomycetaceae bacterium]|jgi:two-component system response regulator HydG|nr:sigma-54 dependent transcriptional regulator [Planctomycetaceae bacterium]